MAWPVVYWNLGVFLMRLAQSDRYIRLVVPIRLKLTILSIPFRKDELDTRNIIDNRFFLYSFFQANSFHLIHVCDGISPLFP